MTRVLAAAAASVALVTALAAFARADAPAGDPEQMLRQAVEAYARAQETTAASERPAAFARAERLFAAAAAEGGASAALWTNVGTAALQAEHLGTAVLAYRRALAADPDHRVAQQNLAHARTLLPAWVPKPEHSGLLDSLVAWRQALSADERRGAAAAAFFAGALLAGVSLATSSPALRVLSLFPLAAWVLLVAAELAAPAERGAVLTVPETVARAADSRNAPARFREPLPAGTEVTIAEDRGTWVRVVLSDGRDAWIPAGSAEPVAPPR